MVNKAKELKKEKARKDREWRGMVVAIYNSTCVICGSKNLPNAHHIIPKGFIETRWDVNNGIILCPKHHKWGKFSAHKHPLWFINKLIEMDPSKHQHLLTEMEKENEN